jgi:hypothetical protein
VSALPPGGGVQQINLGSVPGQVSVTPPEHPEDRKARIEKEGQTHRTELRERTIKFFGGLLLIGIILGSIAWKLLIVGATPDESKILWPTLLGVLGSVVGYVFGQKSK